MPPKEWIDLKEFFTVFAIVAAIIFCNNFVEAAAFNQEHVDKLLDYVDQNPATASANKSTLTIDAEQFKKSFNAEMNPVIAQTKFNNDEEREVMEKIFLIDEFQVFEEEDDKFYLNIFGNSVSVFGVTGNDAPNFKLLACAYIAPENKGEMAISSLVLVSFVKVLVPDANPETFLRELSDNQSGNTVRNGIKFSAKRDGDLIMLSAVKE